MCPNTYALYYLLIGITFAAINVCRCAYLHAKTGFGFEQDSLERQGVIISLLSLVVWPAVLLIFAARRLGKASLTKEQQGADTAGKYYFLQNYLYQIDNRVNGLCSRAHALDARVATLEGKKRGSK